MYDPSTSQRGALVCVGRAPRKKSVDDFEVQPVIHNPHALPLFRDQPSRKRQREKILKDPSNRTNQKHLSTVQDMVEELEPQKAAY